MFRFKINGIEINENPKGWEGITTTIRLDRELKGLFQTMDVTLSFFSDGYDLIKAAYDTYGYCHDISFEIFQRDPTDIGVSNVVWYPIFNGTLFLKNVEFSEGIEGVEAKCKFEDNSFFARINNNKNIKAKCYVGKSKNGETITAATYYKIKYFTPSTGAYITVASGAGNERNNTAFKAYDLLKFFIDFMSDGEVDFISDTFGTGGKYEEYLFTCGYLLRFVVPGGVTQELFDENFPEISFVDVYKELDKQFNLGFITGFDGGRPFIRVEEWPYLFPETINKTFDNIDKIKLTTAQEFLYSSVSIGSDITLNEPFVQFPEAIRLIGFNKEQYTVSGKCNIERDLDLVNSCIISSNVIEDKIINSGTTPTTEDKDLALIHAYFDSGTTYKAYQSNWVTNAATPQYYNETLNSDNKLTRYLGAIPNDIALQLGITDNTFSAYDPLQYDANNPTSAPYIVTLSPLQASVEVADPSGNYNNATYKYTAPVGGVYSFTTLTTWKVENAYYNSDSVNVDIDIYLVNQTTSYDQLIYSQHNLMPGSSLWGFSANGTANLAANDVVYIKIQFGCYYIDPYLANQSSSLRLLPNSTFKCTASADAGGIYASFDPEDAVVQRINLEHPVLFSDFRDIKSDARGLMDISVYNGKRRKAFIEEFKYNHYQNSAKCVMIANKTLNP